MKAFSHMIGRESTFSKTTSDLWPQSWPCQCGDANCWHGRRNGKCYAPRFDAEGHEGRCSCLVFRPEAAVKN